MDDPLIRQLEVNAEAWEKRAAGKANPHLQFLLNKRAMRSRDLAAKLRSEGYRQPRREAALSILLN